MIYMPVPEMKQCKDCGEWKADNGQHFRANKQRPTQPCRRCYGARQKQCNERRRQHYEAHKGEFSERRRRAYARNPDLRRAETKRYRQAHPEKIHERNSRYWAKNKAVLSQNNKTYRRENWDKVAKNRQQWYKQNKDYVREYNKLHREAERTRKARREARKIGLPDTFKIQDWQRCLEYFSYKCAVCGRGKSNQVAVATDHWIPLSDPRPDNPGTVATNIIPLCHGESGCNNSKFNIDPLVWLARKYPPQEAQAILNRVYAYFEWVRQQDSL